MADCRGFHRSAGLIDPFYFMTIMCLKSRNVSLPGESRVENSVSLEGAILQQKGCFTSSLLWKRGEEKPLME